MREQKTKKEAPLAFAGGNSDSFLNTLGALAESIDGVDSYNDAVEIIKKNEKNPARTAAKLCDEPDSPLATSVRLLSTWYKHGLIHPGAFSFQKNDVEAFAASRLSSVLFMSLENHRSFAQRAISGFTSIYFPSEHGANSRIFTGTVYYAVPMIKSKQTETFIKYLVSTEIQENLSREQESHRFWLSAELLTSRQTTRDIGLPQRRLHCLGWQMKSISQQSRKKS